MAGERIHLAGVRAKLSARHEPYWRRVQRNCHIGYRKTASGSETWVARFRDDDRKRHFKSLGDVTVDNDYDKAELAGREWFEQMAQPAPTSKPKTVEDACKAYVADLEARKPAADDGRSAAQNATLIFKRWVYKKPIGETLLSELTFADVKDWRDGLIADKKRKPQTANRSLTAFKAAMNYALKDARYIDSNAAWAGIRPFKADDVRRNIYLTKKQVRDLLAAASPEVQALLRGLLYTGCRPGELPAARVRDLNTKTGILTLRTSKGRGGVSRTRSVPLAGERLEFFKAQARDKLPSAFLITKSDGEPWTRQQWLRAMWDLRDTVEGIPSDFVAYNLRHTVISDWLAAGVPVAQVAMTCGTSIQMIQKHYHQFIQDDELANKLAAINIV